MYAVLYVWLGSTVIPLKNNTCICLVAKEKWLPCDIIILIANFFFNSFLFFIFISYFFLFLIFFLASTCRPLIWLEFKWWCCHTFSHAYKSMQGVCVGGRNHYTCLMMKKAIVTSVYPHYYCSNFGCSFIEQHTVGSVSKNSSEK